MYFLAAALPFYGLAIHRDLMSRTIPNYVSAAVAVLGLSRWALERDLQGFAWAAGVATVAFAVLLVLFARGAMGGGDVKLITASLLLVGAGAAYPFLVLMSLGGGALALLLILLNRLRHREDTVPYGVAISAAALWCLAADAVTQVT